MKYYKLPLDTDLSQTSYRDRRDTENSIYIEYNEGFVGDDWESVTEEALAIAFGSNPFTAAEETAETQLDRIERELLQKNDELRQEGEKEAAQKVAVALSVDYLADAEQITAYTMRLQQVGAQAIQQLSELPMEAGMFKLAYPEWQPDGGTEERLAISVYKGMVYQCMVATQRIAEYAPDIATNNYNPYPEPDADGVYPYVYGMGVIKGMRVREDGVVYCCILETESPYKLIYPPSAVPALFTAE